MPRGQAAGGLIEPAPEELRDEVLDGRQGALAGRGILLLLPGGLERSQALADLEALGLGGGPRRDQKKQTKESDKPCSRHGSLPLRSGFKKVSGPNVAS